MERDAAMLAPELGIARPDVVLSVVDLSRVVRDEAGVPTNLRELLEQGKAAIAGALTPKIPLSSGADTNPGKGSAVTVEEIVNADFASSGRKSAGRL